jgi:hypothetical protein
MRNLFVRLFGFLPKSSNREQRPLRRFVPKLESLEDRTCPSGMMLQLAESGFMPLTITDNGVGDSNPAVGSIVFAGSYGTFSTITAVATSKPNAPNGATEGYIDLTSVVSASSAGTLTFTLADTDFTQPPQGPSMQLSSSAILNLQSASALIQGYTNTSNLSPLPGNPATPPLGSLGAFTTPGYSAANGVFSPSATGGFAGASGPYSLFLQDAVTFAGAGFSSIDHSVNVTGIANTVPLGPNDAATIGFWHNKNGQALINAVNGGPTATNLASWLASNFPGLYGPGSGNDLTGKTNADVAALFMTFFGVKGQKTNAQILAGALASYVTDSALAGNIAASYGFNVTSSGTGALTFNVGSNGAAIGLQNNMSYTIFQLLQQASMLAQQPGGLTTDQANALNNIFDGINQGGDIK